MRQSCTACTGMSHWCCSQGYFAHKKSPPPHHMLLGTCLLQGPRGVRFLLRKVHLYRIYRDTVYPTGVAYYASHHNSRFSTTIQAAKTR